MNLFHLLYFLFINFTFFDDIASAIFPKWRFSKVEILLCNFLSHRMPIKFTYVRIIDSKFVTYFKILVYSCKHFIQTSSKKKKKLTITTKNTNINSERQKKIRNLSFYIMYFVLCN